MKDREITKRKLIDAVGQIIRSKGISAVRISTVARIAGVDRKLVYRYFGNLDNLTETYVTENDYWLLFTDHFKTLLNDFTGDNCRIITSRILQDLFKFFLNKPEMQNLILMEISGSSKFMHSIHNARESMGQKFFESIDPYFKNSAVDFRSVAALLVGGIYYIILHTRNNGHRFTDVDLKTEEGINSIISTIDQIIEWAFIASAE